MSNELNKKLNKKCAWRAWKAIKPNVYTGLEWDRESQQDGAVDLVTNIIHWCKYKNIPWDTVLRRAEMHFKAEIKGGQGNG